MRPSQFGRDILIGAVLGFILLGMAHLATRQPGLYSTGFPVDYSYYVSGCALPGSACRAYNPFVVGLDYLFYAGLAIAVIIVLDVLLHMNSEKSHAALVICLQLHQKHHR